MTELLRDDNKAPTCVTKHIRGTEAAAEEEEDDLAWDELDLDELPDLNAGTTNEKSTNNEQPTHSQEEDWLADIKTDHTKKTGAVVDKESSRQAILSLNTPASQKKPRCILCTRPLLSDQEIDARTCARCGKTGFT